ncbi:hypothetical protein BGZ93_003179 [Podila epicladia]|nr:hypothetical protein BGZ93_003179 [Podila epicladia]
MRWPKPSAVTVLAIGTCIGLAHHADGASQQQQHLLETKAKDIDVISEQNNGKHVCTQFNLVCNSNVVDTINCFEHSNNICYDRNCKVKQAFFIDMAEPCSKYPPQHASIESKDEFVSTLDGAHSEVGTPADLKDLEEDAEGRDSDAVTGTEVLRKRWDQDKHHKYHRIKHHPHYLKPAHLWAGFCVSTGDFCVLIHPPDHLDHLDPRDPLDSLDLLVLMALTELLEPKDPKVTKDPEDPRD